MQAVLPEVCYKEAKCGSCPSKKSYKLAQYPPDYIPLFCDHWLCTKCFTQYVEKTVLSEEFKSPDDLKCPTCQKHINYQLIVSNLQELYPQYEKKILNNFPISPLEQIPVEAECGNNNAKMDNLRREEEKEKNEENEDPKKFLKYTKCPVCQAPIEKVGGCNLMRCESFRCQRKTSFCYLCGDKLNSETEKTHFYGNNQFTQCIKSKNK